MRRIGVLFTIAIMLVGLSGCCCCRCWRACRPAPCHVGWRACRHVEPASPMMMMPTAAPELIRGDR